ncbi:MAG: hypothetical protein P9X27_06670 [Candidatus Kaelpia aquatica]|nr:hypothetical protein [Candidatus Kaelpia aquatica]
MKIKILLSLVLIFGLSISGYCADPTAQLHTETMSDTGIDVRGSDIMINLGEDLLPEYEVSLIEMIVIRENGNIVNVEGVEHGLNEDGSIKYSKPLDLEGINLNGNE